VSKRGKERERETERESKRKRGEDAHRDSVSITAFIA
jgi:hypothetical protein